MSGFSRPARILIVDDSAVMRSLLRSVLSTDSRLELAGTASDGASGLRAAELLRPDLILLDVEMPIMDGLSTLRQLRARNSRVPVIMCSTLTHRGAKITIEALACGAADYVAKPSGQSSREAAASTLAHDLIPKILALTSTATDVSEQQSTSPVFPAGSRVFAPLPSIAAAAISANNPPAQPTNLSPAAVLIGVSTGGPAALDLILPEIPADFPLPILVVQHMPELFTRLLAERLNSRCPLRVREALAGEPIRPGHIYIAQGGRHMEVAATATLTTPVDIPPAVLRLTSDEPVNHCRPSVDVLFRSAVTVYGPRILALVLTGMGYDGLAGSRLIRQHGGTVFAQDQNTSAVWGMPGAVAQAGLANRILPLSAIATEILRFTSRSQREAVELRESVV